MKNRTVVWEGLDWKSMECLQLSEQAHGFFINSHLTGVIDGNPFAFHYAIHIDKDWQVQRFAINDLIQPANNIDISSDTNGKWFTRDQELARFEGCYDIDISLTPFTNTLPIRRLKLEPAKRTAIDVLYIKLPEFELKKVSQYYTRLKEHLFLYEGVFRDFKAELPVDEDFLVIDYPELAKRLYPASKRHAGKAVL